MRAILDIQQQLLPDLTDTLKKRYTILHHVMVSGLIGRRPLALSMGMTERVLRAEVELLKNLGMLDTDAAGMRISETGRNLVEQLEPLIKQLFGLHDLEEQLKLRFHLLQVIVVPGDSDVSPITKKELGRSAAAVLRKVTLRGDTIAVTGGSTMAEVANQLVTGVHLRGNLFVPARGGLGESVELQANSIVSTMAKKTGGSYRLLHVPDHLENEAYQSLMQDPTIQEIVEVIRKARIVVHGIGEAIVMARRRKVDTQTVTGLKDEGALAEAFGYYFNKFGEVVHKMATAGLRLEDIHQTETVIAVAGGHSKGEAIAAVLRHGHEDVLITDEAAALEILKHVDELV